MKHVRGRREGGRDRPRAGRRSAEAPDGVGRHMRAHGGGLRACEAYGRAVVEEVRGATKGERIVSGPSKSPKSSKKLTAWRWERTWSRRRNSPWMQPEVDMMAGRKARSRSPLTSGSGANYTLACSFLVTRRGGRLAQVGFDTC